MPPLTREVSQANAVGTQPVQTDLPDNSLANTIPALVQTADVQYQRKAEAEAKDSVETLLAAEKIDTVPNDIGAEIERGKSAVEADINAELSPVDKMERGVKQGRITRERLVTELQSRAKKLNAKYPGYGDIIQREIVKRTGINPDQASLQLILSQGAEDEFEYQKMYTKAVEYDAVVYNTPGVFSSGVDRDATARKLHQVMLQRQEASLKLAGTKAGASKEDMAYSFATSLSSLQAGSTAYDTLTTAFEEFVETGGDPLATAAFKNVAALAREREKKRLREFYEEQQKQGVMLPEDWTDKLHKEVDRKWSYFGDLSNYLSTDINLTDAAELLKAQAEVEGFVNMPFVTKLLRLSGPNAVNAFGAAIFNTEIMKSLQAGSYDELIAAVNNPDFNEYRTITDSTSAYYAFRNAMLTAMFPTSGDVSDAKAELPSDAPPQLLQTTVEKTYQIARDLGNKTLDNELDRRIWGSALVTLGNQFYKHFIAESKANKTLLRQNMFKPSFDANLNALKSDGQELGYESINEFRANVARDYFKDQVLKANERMPGTGTPFEYNVETGEFRLTPAAEASSFSEMLRNDYAKDLGKLLKQAKLAGYDPEFVLDELTTGVKVIGGNIYKTEPTYEGTGEVTDG